MIGRRFRVNRYEHGYPWLIVKEDDVYIYATYNNDKKIYKQCKSILERYPLIFEPLIQLTLF